MKSPSPTLYRQLAYLERRCAVFGLCFAALVWVFGLQAGKTPDVTAIIVTIIYVIGNIPGFYMARRHNRLARDLEKRQESYGN